MVSYKALTNEQAMARRLHVNIIMNLFQRAAEAVIPLLTDACQQRLFRYLIMGSECSSAHLGRLLNPRYFTCVSQQVSALYS